MAAQFRKKSILKALQTRYKNVISDNMREKMKKGLGKKTLPIGEARKEAAKILADRIDKQRREIEKKKFDFSDIEARRMEEGIKDDQESKVKEEEAESKRQKVLRRRNLNYDRFRREHEAAKILETRKKLKEKDRKEERIEKATTEMLEKEKWAVGSEEIGVQRRTGIVSASQIKKTREPDKSADQISANLGHEARPLTGGSGALEQAKPIKRIPGSGISGGLGVPGVPLSR